MAATPVRRWREMFSTLMEEDAPRAVEFLREMMFADTMLRVDCPHSCCAGRKGRQMIKVPDYQTRIQTIRFIAEHAEGRLRPEDQQEVGAPTAAQFEQARNDPELRRQLSLRLQKAAAAKAGGNGAA